MKRDISDSLRPWLRMIKRYWMVCLLAAIGVFAYLLSNPSTRTILRIQLSMFVAPPRSFTGSLQALGIRESSILPGEAAVARRALARTAAIHPGDADTQVAFAVIGGVGTPEPYVDRVQPLLALFPTDPFVQATFMRYACMGQIAVRRPEESLLTADKPSAASLAGNNMLPGRLADYLKAADVGEKFESDNAYFPWMKCVALFGARKDKEALATLHRAAGKKRFYEYLDREVRAHWRLTDEAHGETTAVTHIATQMSLVFPHYSQLRAVARTATYLAAEKERAGKMEEGLQIRMDLMNLSAMMRLQSTAVIGTLVGAGIENIAMARPGGAPPVSRRQLNEDDVAASERRQEKYLAYLRNTGHFAEARWTKDEAEASKAARDLVKDRAGKVIFGGAPFLQLIRSWTLGMIFLSNSIWLGVLWTIGAALFPAVKGRSGGLSAGEGGMLIGVCGGCLILLMGLLTWQEARSIDVFNQYKMVVDNVTMSGTSQASPQIPIGPSSFIAASVALPAFVFFAAAFGSMFRRQALLESFLAGLRNAAPLGLLAASAGYLLIMLQTTRLESHASLALDRSIGHEGRRLAELEGRTWPGEVLRMKRPDESRIGAASERKRK